MNTHLQHEARLDNWYERDKGARQRSETKGACLKNLCYLGMSLCLCPLPLSPLSQQFAVARQIAELPPTFCYENYWLLDTTNIPQPNCFINTTRC
jgi:hypothetical protein